MLAPLDKGGFAALSESLIQPTPKVTLRRKGPTGEPPGFPLDKEKVPGETPRTLKKGGRADLRGPVAEASDILTVAFWRPSSSHLRSLWKRGQMISE